MSHICCRFSSFHNNKSHIDRLYTVLLAEMIRFVWKKINSHLQIPQNPRLQIPLPTTLSLYFLSNQTDTCYPPIIKLLNIFQAVLSFSVVF